MIDQHLYLAIGVPIVANIATMLLGFTLMSNSLNKRMDDLSTSLNKRIDALRTDMNARFDLMDHVIDARLKHLEER